MASKQTMPRRGSVRFGKGFGMGYRSKASNRQKMLALHRSREPQDVDDSYDQSTAETDSATGYAPADPGSVDSGGG